jgi:uncharacterized protein YndB with AHSA1/START domain
MDRTGMPPDDTRPVAPVTETFPAEREFVESRFLHAPPETVFAAWTDHDRLTRWWGPAGFTTPVAQIDLRPGGAWRIVTRAPDGREYPLKGIYQEIEPPARLVMRMGIYDHPGDWHETLYEYRRDQEGRPLPEMAWVVTFEPRPGGTLITFRARFATRTERHAMLKMGMAEAWAQSLDRLAAYLAGE